MKIRLVPSIITVTVSLLVLLVAYEFRALSLSDQRYNQRVVAQQKLTLVAATLSQAVNVRLNHTRSLAAFVKTNQNFTNEEFSQFTAVLQKDLVGLRSLQLAPNGVVQYLTNLENNKAALGHDLFSDPKRRHLAEKSVRERSYIIAGPINLKQGGAAIIARRPLFFKKITTGQEEFWGFATALIDVEPLLADAKFTELKKEFVLAIRGEDGLGAKGEIFYGKKRSFDDALAIADVILPGGSWQIGAWMKPDALYTGFFLFHWFWASTGIVLFIVGAAVYVVVDQPFRLRAAVRTATAELSAARDAAQAANIAKSEFLAIVSHELRTPLTSIKGYLSLIHSGSFGVLSEKITNMVDIAHRNTNRLINLVNDVLDVEKIVSGSMKYEFSLLDLGRLVTDAVEANQGYADEYGVKFVLTDISHDVAVNGDSGRLSQVIANLLSNAAKFSPPGSKIKIFVMENNGFAKVSIRDVGSGVPESFRENIFDKFMQADSTDSRKKGGTGLGLNISNAIVEMHGGKIDFNSEVGVGSTFFFTLPVWAGPHQASKPS
ncbi:MAG: signal transduction histidine kinase/predicted component of type VI protein secretion system [Arenicella sp.]|jgi:signal transduction histidine kinase/predicted component of type VI protein secretion system